MRCCWLCFGLSAGSLVVEKENVSFACAATMLQPCVDSCLCVHCTLPRKLEQTLTLTLTPTLTAVGFTLLSPSQLSQQAKTLMPT